MRSLVICGALMVSASSSIAETKSVCAVFRNLPSHRGHRIQVEGIFTTLDLDDALLPEAPCANVYKTQGYGFAAGIVIGFPRTRTGESSFPGPAGAAFQEILLKAKREGQRRRIRLVVNGRLSMNDDYGLGYDNSNSRLPSRGFGHSKRFAAELVVDRFVKLEDLGPS